MSLIGSIPANSEGTISRSYVPAILSLNASDVFDKIQVSISGKSQIYIQNGAHVKNFLQLMQRLSGKEDAIGNVLVAVADGFQGNETFELVLNSTSGSPQEVSAFSVSKGIGLYTQAGQSTLQPNDSLYFEGSDFDFLILNEPNFDYAQITFADGHEDKLTPSEIKNLLASKINSVNGGLPDDTLGIDNTDDSINGVTLYTDSGGTCLVTQIILQ